VIKPKTGVRAQKVVPPPAAPVVVPPGPPAGPAPEPAPAPPDKDAAPSKGSSTNSPLPRFATLRSDDVNLRSGPGTRYPIDWVYKRRDLPVVIEREFDMWRLVRDPDGIKGWVNQATLAPRRSGVVTASAQAGGAQAGGAQAGGAQAGGAQTMRSDPSDTAAAVAILKPGVIVRLRSCEATSDWCQVSVQDYRGWLRRTQFWGTLPGEAVQ
jgi:SH3-like domain-containing protein